MLEKAMDFITWFLLGVGGILTVEEAVSVAYVGIQRSVLSDIAVWCLIGSVATVFIGGIVLSIKEAVEALVK
ncbi:MAG: hypothetical protein ILA11_11105 [Butyrivibrio sp.]|nr:hypothetical protein [Butyrivibrio sp.]